MLQKDGWKLCDDVLINDLNVKEEHLDCTWVNDLYVRAPSPALG